MDLKEFVKESLVQISSGITEANEALDGTGAMVNPLHVRVNSDQSQAYGRTGAGHMEGRNTRVVEKIDFDVAVVAEQGEKTKAGMKLAVASIGLGVNGQSQNTDRSESRIRFSIPVVLPGVDSNT